MTEDVGSQPVPGSRPRRLRAGAAVALLLLIGLVLWLVLRDGGSPSSSPIPKGSKPVPVSPKGLRTIAGLGITIYWAGERAGFAYELTKTDDNRVFIRYLPAGEPIGTGKQNLTIGTYPVKNAFAVTSRLATRGDSVRVGVGPAAVAFYRQDIPTNIFLAHRGSAYQVEVYDPSSERARELVASGQVTPVR